MTRDEIRKIVIDALAGVAPEGEYDRLKPDRPLRDQLAIEMQLVQGGVGLARDDFRARLCPGSRRNVREEAHPSPFLSCGLICRGP